MGWDDNNIIQVGSAVQCTGKSLQGSWELSLIGTARYCMRFCACRFKPLLLYSLAATAPRPPFPYTFPCTGHSAPAS